MKKLYSNPTVSVKLLAAETMMAQSGTGGDMGDLGYGGNATGQDNTAESRQTVSKENADLFI